MATDSDSHRCEEPRVFVDTTTAGNPYIRLARTTPATPPAVWARMYAHASRHRVRPPSRTSAIVTTGFRWAPDTGPTARMIATSAAAVAAALSKR